MDASGGSTVQPPTKSKDLENPGRKKTWMAWQFKKGLYK
jgi:hypothetical protein